MLVTEEGLAIGIFFSLFSWEEKVVENSLAEVVRHAILSVKIHTSIGRIHSGNVTNLFLLMLFSALFTGVILRERAVEMYSYKSFMGMGKYRSRSM